MKILTLLMKQFYILLLSVLISFQASKLTLSQTVDNVVQNMVIPQQEKQTAEVQQGQENPGEMSIFGHNFFVTSEPLKGGFPIGGVMFPETYLLGPGDRVGIYLSGKIQENFEVIVNVEGKIYIPTVGVFYIENLTLQEFSPFLEKQLSKYYDNFSLNVMLIEPKKIPVMVVGDVNRPGKYFLTSLNTVLDAVIVAGGPSPTGSLRNIEIYRQDKMVDTVDLYQFLITGRVKNEIFLQQYDRIVVPLFEAIVTVDGEVKRPAKFELKSGGRERLSDVIALAGGFTDLAFLDKVELSRLLPDGERTVCYIDYHEIQANDSCASNILLKNDDRIHVFSILEQTHPKYVYIHGAIKKPGQYLLEENLHVLDLIIKAGNLTRSAYTLECEVAKIDPKTPTKFQKINLQNLLNNPNSEANLLLEEDDRLFVRQIPEWQVGPTVEVKGEVEFPGIYAITKDSTRLSEIIDKAGGFTHEALIREASLTRASSKIVIDKEFERLMQLTRDQMSESEYQYFVMKQNSQDIGRIVIDFYKLCVLKQKSEDVILEDGDIINVPMAPKVVYVTGRVGRPGGVLYNQGKGVKYYIKKAGGATWDAKGRGIKVTKITGEILDDEDVKNLVPGDIIWVPRKSDRDWWEIFRQTITIIAQLATVYIIVDSAIKK